MLPTDRICAKTEKVAPTTMNYISKQSQFLLQEIKLVYGIQCSYKQTDPQLQHNMDGEKSTPLPQFAAF